MYDLLLQQNYLKYISFCSFPLPLFVLRALWSIITSNTEYLTVNSS